AELSTLSLHDALPIWVAKRMNSRDLEQVALVAELQLTTGGNVAEVLDVVVGTIRDRQDVRRLLKTLTAQGRMARWILTGLPIVRSEEHTSELQSLAYL